MRPGWTTPSARSNSCCWEGDSRDQIRAGELTAAGTTGPVASTRSGFIARSLQVWPYDDRPTRSRGYPDLSISGPLRDGHARDCWVSRGDVKQAGNAFTSSAPATRMIGSAAILVRRVAKGEHGDCAGADLGGNR